MSGLERLIEACRRGHGVAVVKIDAALAAELLTLNTANRPLSQSRVVLLARKMSLGEWMFTGQAHVIVSSKGTLLNGQHTLSAVIRADAVIETVVVTGVDPAAFAKIDIGARRSAMNAFAVLGVDHGKDLAAVVRVVERYDTLRRSERGWTSTEGYDPDDVVRLFDLDPDAFSAAILVARAAAAKASATGLRIAVSASGAFRYLAVREGRDPEAVDHYVARVVDDAGHHPDDPALTLRRWLAANNPRGADAQLRGLSAWIKTYKASEQGRSLSKVYAWTRETPDYPRL